MAVPTLVEDEEEGTAQLVAVQSRGYYRAPRVQGEELRAWHMRVSHQRCAARVREGRKAK